MHSLRIRPFWTDPEKHSKNNIRLLSPRGIELFSKLPEDIKIILGDVFNEEKWDEIKDSGVIPAYLADIEIEGELGRQTCGNISQESHLVETTPPPNVENVEMSKLYEEVTSKDPDPAVRRGIQDNQVLEQLDEGGDLVDDEGEEDEVPSDPAGINVENILPYRTRRRVRFALPQLN